MKPLKACENCGEVAVVDRADRRYCGAVDCQRRSKREYMREYFRRMGGNKHAKPEHGAAYRKRVGYTETKRAHDQLRRARKAGARVEVVRPLEVFERDDWTCGICAEPVDSSLSYPDKRSPSLDHITPLSLGGEHSKANTRLAHLECNVRRGNRTEPALAAGT